MSPAGSPLIAAALGAQTHPSFSLMKEESNKS